MWAAHQGQPYQEYAEAEIEAEVRRSLFPTLWSCRRAADDDSRQSGRRCEYFSIATRSIHRIPYAAAKAG